MSCMQFALGRSGLLWQEQLRLAALGREAFFEVGDPCQTCFITNKALCAFGAFSYATGAAEAFAAVNGLAVVAIDSFPGTKLDTDAAKSACLRGHWPGARRGAFGNVWIGSFQS